MNFYRSIIALALLLPSFWAPLAEADDNSLFTGQVVDTANNPVSGAEVYVFDSANVKRPADFISKRTGKDGLFKIELPHGRYWTMAITRSSGKTFGPLGINDRHSGEPVEIDLTGKNTLSNDYTVMDLREAARANQKRSKTIIKVSGKIINSDGIPVKMAYVMADPHQKFGALPQYISTWTEADGRYVIFLPKGKFFIGTNKDFPPTDDYVLTKEIEFETDTDGVDLNILPVTP